MKRKRLDRDIWTSMTRKEYTQREARTEGFEGVVGLLKIHEVSRISAWNLEGERVEVCAPGMTWVQLLPKTGHYLITAKYGPDGALRLWYIDMIAGQERDPDGVAVFWDLYLDLIVRPGGWARVDDMDELEDALRRQVISRELFDYALETKVSLERGLLRDLKGLEQLCSQFFAG